LERRYLAQQKVHLDLAPQTITMQTVHHPGTSRSLVAQWTIKTSGTRKSNNVVADGNPEMAAFEENFSFIWSELSMIPIPI